MAAPTPLNVFKLHRQCSDLPPSLPGFEHINRYWDKLHGTCSAKILPGEYYVTTQPELIVTVLGSCVSACVRDPVFGIGGMNHFMLPQSGGGNVASTALSDSARYGNVAMEHLINEILTHGGQRGNLEVKLFGGGRVMAGMSDIGGRNISFVRDYLEVEGFEAIAEDLGGTHPRKVVYNPKTGKVLMKKLRSMHNNTIIERETAYMHELEARPISGEVDLF